MLDKTPDPYAAVPKHLRAFLHASAHKTGCWEWPGYRNPDGYGRSSFRGRPRSVHRSIFISLHGDLPAGGFVCHRCDNPACARPDHLFLGTAKDNYADAKSKGRNMRGDRSPVAKLNDDAVRDIRTSSETQLALAAKYQVRQSLISRVINRKSWAHVED